MKVIASNTSSRLMTQLAQRLNLGRILEGTFGTGAMTAGYKRATPKTGWTTEQLLAMSAAKSFYN
ncbi:MAG: hypothetical protein DCF25_16140 [Leptolyngbya foveolarum]|uniref:Uncharacterized protein n=1 Tax=Leptolyngbya foveolarum TaxID=47253 RepID=A0A2W4U8G4_9CYAN|nr:MAG: hypothetical protein DCF25_16140 [Leptolyngbya foveolarum]